ncbi:MFS transporter [Sphaerotilus microaerophilus]|uniref:MFS transporter n=1 Tax=Sphaerotilus microaerophilus TaxID=2914710 RepID=A0ABM7YLL6_9BURK|nr:MFS transporter [Sphaerotilus sp. FB-5]BDI05334.1 MFS transporter [Sphaerotilus sp. FB-5]
MSSIPDTPYGADDGPMTAAERRVVLASSLGTVFEWYDFYLYGSLATIIAQQFFAGLDPTSAFIFALLAFAAGFLVRPFGALVFGRLGDMIGRKYTFMVTILLMGASTFIVGILPTYATIGVAAPAILIVLRLLQGLALGGEYGGAATYVAEHAPQGRRGAYTAWIQTTATLGLFLSLLVILGTRQVLGEQAFADWGWRVPFIVSIVLLGVSVWIRMSMRESPAFLKMQMEGKTSKAPLSECFGEWKNLRIIVLALFGLVAGQAVVWYTGQFYALFFLTSVLKVEASTANLLVAAALLIGTPFFVVFGSLSDRFGRKPIIMSGLALACLTYFPLFQALTSAANPDLARAQATAQIVVQADPVTCSFQGSPIAREIDFTSACDIAKRTLAQNAASYRNEALPSGEGARVRVGEKVIAAPNARIAAEGGRFEPASVQAVADFRRQVVEAMRAAGYPERADPAKLNKLEIVLILSVLVIYVTMVYGPIAATLVELFPTRIRYTSMSLPYHIGNGWFGGLMPTIAFAMVASNGDIYHGLWYPIVVAAMTLVIGLIFIRETKDVDIYAKFLYWHPNRLSK